MYNLNNLIKENNLILLLLILIKTLFFVFDFWKAIFVNYSFFVLFYNYVIFKINFYSLFSKFKNLLFFNLIIIKINILIN